MHDHGIHTLHTSPTFPQCNTSRTKQLVLSLSALVFPTLSHNSDDTIFYVSASYIGGTTCLLPVGFLKIPNRQPPFDLINHNLLKNANCAHFASGGCLLLPRARTNYGIKTLSFTAILLGNLLPPDMKSSSNLYTFEKAMKLFFVS